MIQSIECWLNDTVIQLSLEQILWLIKKSISILKRSKCSSFLCSIKSYFSVSRVCLMFVFVFLLLFVWSLSSHSRIFTRMETSPLPVMGCKFWPMLGTHGHWAVRVLFSPNNYGKSTLKWSAWLFHIILLVHTCIINATLFIKIIVRYLVPLFKQMVSSITLTSWRSWLGEEIRRR